METYPPALAPNGIGCCPNLRIFVYRILGELLLLLLLLLTCSVSLINENTGPGTTPTWPQPVLLLLRTTQQVKKGGGAGLGLFSWLLLSNVDTAQLALRKAHPLHLPCPAVPLPAGLHAGPETTSYMRLAGVRFPAIAILDASPRLYTREQPGSTARQEESCIGFPPSPSLSLPMTTTHTHTIHTIHFPTCIPPAAVVSSTISLFTLPTIRHINSSVAYLELQHSSLPRTTLPRPSESTRGAFVLAARCPEPSLIPAQGLASPIKADPLRTTTSRQHHREPALP